MVVWDFTHRPTSHVLASKLKIIFHKSCSRIWKGDSESRLRSLVGDTYPARLLRYYKPNERRPFKCMKEVIIECCIKSEFPMPNEHDEREEITFQNKWSIKSYFIQLPWIHCMIYGEGQKVEKEIVHIFSENSGLVTNSDVKTRVLSCDLDIWPTTYSMPAYCTS